MINDKGDVETIDKIAEHRSPENNDDDNDDLGQTKKENLPRKGQIQQNRFGSTITGTTSCQECREIPEKLNSHNHRFALANTSVQNGDDSDVDGNIEEVDKEECLPLPPPAGIKRNATLDIGSGGACGSTGFESPPQDTVSPRISLTAK